MLWGRQILFWVLGEGVFHKLRMRQEPRLSWMPPAFGVWGTKRCWCPQSPVLVAVRLLVLYGGLWLT